MNIKLLWICFFCFWLVYEPSQAQQYTVALPPVVLKGIETSIEVTPHETNGQHLLTSIKVNGEDVALVLKDGFYEGRVVIEHSTIELEKDFALQEPPLILPAWTTILPPIIAILLALLFKEVLTALFIGILSGTMIMGYFAGGFLAALAGFFKLIDTYVIQALTDSGHVAVIVFSLTIGAIVAIISKNGGMLGVVNLLIRFAKTRKSGMLTTYFLGIAIFFDDYANTLVVGNTMRSVTDKLKVSREKLAYIVDSTAAPIAAIAFITTWIGAELTYISDGVQKIEETGVVIQQSAYGIFMDSLAYSFYPIFTLFFVFVLLWKGKDYGPMRRSELMAQNGTLNKEEKKVEELEEFEPLPDVKPNPWNAIIPVFTIITGTFIGLIYTGIKSIQQGHDALINANISDVWQKFPNFYGIENSFFQKLGLVIGEADSYQSLLWASLTALLLAVLLTLGNRIMSLHQIMATGIQGIKAMIPAMLILVLAWALAGVIEDMGTAIYLKSFFSADFNAVWLIPAITFVLAAVIAFSTGSSWSTMALLYPLVIPLSFAIAVQTEGYAEMPILYNTIASVLAGAVLGDHCSPISDTTILSSLATGCDHIQHVKTQMPYALTVGAVALFVGVIPAALGIPSWILFISGALIIFWIISIFAK
jgi:Na+/H+ antiporter NhaC